MPEQTWTRGVYALEAYLNHKRLSQAAFARIIGCSGPHLNSIMRGRRVPGPRVRRAIAEATAGAWRMTVKEEYWFQPPQRRIPRAKEV